MNRLLRKYHLYRYYRKKSDLYISIHKQSVFADRTPIEPWAFIRVFNEISTIAASLNSILPAINKGVIAYHDSTELADGSIEFIHNFCAQHPGFIPYHYPYKVLHSHHSDYQWNVPIKNRLDSYYNAALAKIPHDAWIIKIDADQIFNSEKLKNSFRLPVHDTDIVIYSRINLHYANKKLYVHRDHPLTESGDQFLIKNKNLNFIFNSGFKSDGEFFACEFLPISSQARIIRTELTNWHFPALKSWRQNVSSWPAEKWLPYAEWHLTKQQRAQFKGRLSEEMLSAEEILFAIRHFRLNNQN